MAKFVLEGDPGMLRFFPNGYCRLGEGRIGKGAEGYADSVRSYFGVPKHRGPAIGTEIEPHLAPFLPVSDMLLAQSVDSDLTFREKHGDAKRRAGASLTLATVTGGDNDRLASGIRSQRSATATGNSHNGWLLMSIVIQRILVECWWRLTVLLVSGSRDGGNTYAEYPRTHAAHAVVSRMGWPQTPTSGYSYGDPLIAAAIRARLRHWDETL